MPVSLVEKMSWAEQLTAKNELLTFFVPINYGGRGEILQAAQQFHGSTEEDFAALLYAPDMHDPELLIRAGAEQRLSNFLLWQVANAWLVFSMEMWPEFSRASFEAAINEFREIAVRRAAHQSEQAGRGVNHYPTAGRPGPLQKPDAAHARKYEGDDQAFGA